MANQKLREIAYAGQLPDYFDLIDVLKMFVNGEIKTEEDIDLARAIYGRASIFNRSFYSWNYPSGYKNERNKELLEKIKAKRNGTNIHNE